MCVKLFSVNVYICFVLLFFSTVTKIQAQDAQLSQYYASPLYLNPSLAGTSGDGRATINYRNQWVGIPLNYNTFMASFDTPIPKKNFGVGFLAHQDILAVSSGTSMTRLSINMTGAYHLKINKKYNLSFGIQGGFEQSSLGFNSFTFNDQIDNDGNISGSTADQLTDQNKIYPDISSGLMFYSKQLWVGASVYHINQPNISRLVNSVDILPLRFSVNMGYRIPLTYKWKGAIADYDDKTISLMMHYQSQGTGDQLSLGASVNYNPIIFGVWYRGLPIKANDHPTQLNHDAVVVMSGVKFNRFVIGYSFDFPIGGLTLGEGNSHEISIRYDLNFYPNYYKKRNLKKEIPSHANCPVPSI
ncbi:MULTISPECIES: type IX secretion system membrane protein PorP/SprF [unclassified Flammeovirga]|uniref:PorP/SprF family type IX secretion system membrane protein n=1 Tax=unclassified Flammeovirga TaxID=2637820 RepID=UPI0009E3F791|nr:MULTISPECIES: type IX secretion system membrane protein PorP/SprF [unclassified Flammeovirga]MBD0403871.1 type IX secretion system membrane protein PorP/SprF [Flammeovirga sp. EKP202]